MSFDLNINNYTTDELISMFELTFGYDESMINIKYTKLKENIINNKQINNETKQNILFFIENARKTIIQNNLRKNISDIYHTNTNLTSIPVEFAADHVIQKRQQQPYIGSLNSDFHTGSLNPIVRRTILKQLNFDTTYRENYLTSPSTNCFFNIPEKIENVLQMQLSSLEFPKIFCIISNQYGNNFFIIAVEESIAIINIPNNNYHSTTLIDVINEQIQLAGDKFNEIKFIIDSSNNKTVVTTGNLLTNIQLKFNTDKNGNVDSNTPLPLKLGWILGFRSGTYNNNNNIIVSESSINTSGPKYLFLCVNDYNNSVTINNSYNAYTSLILNRNVLARIATSILEQNNQEIKTIPREYFGPVTLQRFNIQLLDEYGRIIDLNNLDYSFNITLTTTYDI
jgi:hypothetical protein